MEEGSPETPMEGKRHQVSKQRWKDQIRFTYVEQFDVADNTRMPDREILPLFHIVGNTIKRSVCLLSTLHTNSLLSYWHLKSSALPLFSPPNRHDA